jgi:cobalt-precorrin 5A hydrolase/precorrin-3B C17-methyltransferase
LLQRLQQCSLTDQLALTPGAAAAIPDLDGTCLVNSAAVLLQQHWQEGGVLIVIGATGAVTRLIAPLLTDKDSDPAVLVLDAKGQRVVPLLGGHQAGAEQLSREVAAALGGEAVLTGDSAVSGRLASDAFGHGWGWKRGGTDANWSQLMKAQARGEATRLIQTMGSTLWQSSSAAQASQLLGPDAETGSAIPTNAIPTLEISTSMAHAGACTWHPPLLWLGIGCERETSLNLVERAVSSALEEAGLAESAVAGITSIDRKGDERALQALAQLHHWPFRLHTASALNEVPVPTPSQVVAAEMGTGSVAEAAALLSAGDKARLKLSKRITHANEAERGAVTVAIAESMEAHAPQRGELHLIGSGPGDLALLTPEARSALERCPAWVGYGLYLDLLEPLRRSDQIRLDGQLTMERDRCRQALSLACQGVRVALVSSGDSGIYGMAGLALELWMELPENARPRFAVHPGISALQLAAAKAGAPLMHDFCTVSLSDRLTPWEVIERRLEAAASGDFVVALYNPRSKGRDWQLQRAKDILLTQRPDATPVVIARQLGRQEEHVSFSRLDSLPVDTIDMLTVLVIGNSSSRMEGGRMVTPRGYPGAELS